MSAKLAVLDIAGMTRPAIDRRIVQEVLESSGLRSIDWEMSFYENGGNSLEFVSFGFELASKLNIEIDTVDLEPTIPLEALVERLVPATASGQTSSITLHQDSRGEVNNQGEHINIAHPNRAWHARLGDDASWTTVSDIYRIDLAFDRNAVLASVDHLLSVHKGLTLRLSAKGDPGVERFVRWDGEVEFLEVDLSRLSDAYRSYAIDAARAFRDTVSSHSGGFRLLVIHSGAAVGFDVFFAYHHICVDRMSKRIVERYFFEMYQASLQGAAMRRSLSVDFPTFVRVYASECEEQRAKAEKFHKQTIDANVAPPPIKNSDGRDDMRERWTREVGSVIPPEEIARLCRHLAEHKVSLSEHILMCLAKAYMKWAGGDGFRLALAYHGRHLKTADTVETVGWLTDIIPLVVEHRTDTSDILSSVRTQIASPEIAQASNYFQHTKQDAAFMSPWPDISLNMILDSSQSISKYPEFVSRLILRSEIKDLNPKTLRPHLISGGVVMRPEGLRVSWDFNSIAIDEVNMSTFLSVCMSEIRRLDTIS